MIQRVLVLVAASAALASVMVGCGGDADKAAPASAPPAPAVPTPPLENVIEFGQTYTFPSGAAARVWAFDCEATSPSRPGETVPGGSPMVGLHVTVTNAPNQIVSPDIVLYGSSQGRALEQINFDFGGRCDYPELGDLFPNESVTYTTNMAVYVLSDVLRVEVGQPRPAAEFGPHPTVYFSGVPGPAGSTGPPSFVPPDASPGPTDAECDARAEELFDQGLPNATVFPQLRNEGCADRLEELEEQAQRDIDAAEEAEVGGGCDYADGCIPPNMNVGPDGYCTATPCGSNGRAPELTCAGLGIPESNCGPDGRYTP